jgi:hypothetical protein
MAGRSMSFEAPVHTGNGAIATAFSAEEPDGLRGPQHDVVLAAEFSAWAMNTACSSSQNCSSNQARLAAAKALRASDWWKLRARLPHVKAAVVLASTFTPRPLSSHHLVEDHK